MFEMKLRHRAVPLEKTIERSLVRQVKQAGGKAYKFNSEMNRGVSDRLIVFPGQVWFVEVKRPGGQLTALQKSFRTLIRDKLKLNYFLVNDELTIEVFLNKVKERTRNDKSTKAKNI